MDILTLALARKSGGSGSGSAVAAHIADATIHTSPEEKQKLVDLDEAVDILDGKVAGLLEEVIPEYTAIDALLQNLGLEIINGKLCCRYREDEEDDS